LPFVRKFLKGKSQEKIDAFATHAYRYFTLYIPYGTVEIAHTSRYTFRTHKSELCVLALAPITAGSYITQLEGTMARLTADEDAALSMSKNNGYEGRKDFSVVQLAGSNQNMMFLGPARFVNHDCQPNAMLERKDKVMRFKALKNINAAEEITAYYADDYFGSGNRECLCKTCEDLGRGG
ncbi:SET domain-containing protein, partial [Clavulina sp. PMI_390]